MLNRKTLKRHAALVDRMAGAQGLDLEEEILRGNLTIPDLDDAVLRCAGCSEPAACEASLDAGDTAPGTAPAYCRNTDLFAALRNG